MMDLLADFLSYGLLAPLGVIGVFFVLIFIHELGHFAVGRYFGVRVEEFALGFGPVLLSRTDSYGTLSTFARLQNWAPQSTWQM